MMQKVENDQKRLNALNNAMSILEEEGVRVPFDMAQLSRRIFNRKQENEKFLNQFINDKQAMELSS